MREAMGGRGRRLGSPGRQRGLVSRRGWVPERGDLLRVNFDPQAGHEQREWRPALVISPRAYNEASSLALLCPVTSKAKGYPFEVPLPPGLPIAGVILADQVRALDWRARGAQHAGDAPHEIVDEVLARLVPLVT